MDVAIPGIPGRPGITQIGVSKYYTSALSALFGKIRRTKCKQFRVV